MSQAFTKSAVYSTVAQRRPQAALFAFGVATFVVANVALAQVPPAAPRAAAPAAAGAPTNAAPAATDERGYKVLVPYERMLKEKKFEGEVKMTVRKVIQDSSPLSDNRRAFDAYYALYFFPLMTQTTDEALQAMPDERMKFLRNDLENCKNLEVQTHLTSLTFDEMLAITRDPEFHPAVRYNALHIIGSLNDKEVVRFGSAPNVPEPMARALPVLLEEFRRAENNDALKVAALIGLSRHLEWDPYREPGSAPIPAALRTEIVKELITLAEAKEPPSGRTAEGHLWFRRRAIEALGLACAVKTDAAVAAAFDKLLKDDAESVALRATVAAAVGRLKYEAPVKVDALAMAKQLGYVALVACDSELNRVSNLKMTETERAARIAKGVVTFTPGDASGSGSGGTGIDSSSAGMFVPEAAPAGATGGIGRGTAQLVDLKAYRFDHVRRRLRHQLYCVQLGLNGGMEKAPTRGMLAVAKAPADIEAINNIDKSVRKLIETVEVKAVDMAQLEKDLRKNMTALEAITKKLAAPAVAAPSDVPAGDVPAAPAAAAPAGTAPEAAAPAGDDVPADLPVTAPPPAPVPPAAAPPAADAAP
jgi:hypothetical protein